MFHYNITVPPGGQTVLFPSVTECFFLLSPFICFLFSLIIWRCPQKAIYLFLMWLYDVFIGKAVTKSVQHVSSRARKKKERTYRYCIQAILPVCISWWNSIKSSVLFIKEYFYCYFVVKRRECKSLDCIMSWELPGRFSLFNSTNGKMLTAWLETFLFFI